MSRTLISFVIIASLGLPAHAAIIKGPYVQNMGTASMTIMWETDSSSASTVEYGQSESLGSGTTGAAGTLHQVRLSGLSEDTLYYYKVVSGSDSSAVYTFRTASSTSTTFRFIAVGDSQSGPSVVAALSGMIDALNPRAALTIHTGDVVLSGTAYSTWDTDLFAPQHPMMASIPLYVSIGNHEENAQYFHDFFDLPGNERWYSFEYGNAVFIAIDSNTQYTSYAPGSEQYSWLETTLRKYANKTWKIVFFHNPAYSTGTHGSDQTVRTYLQPLFERYHVNIVFNGHDHDYERSIVNGVTYIVTGGFGAPLRSQQTTSPYSQIFSSVHHFCVADINGASLALNAVDESGGSVENINIDSPALPVSVITAPSEGQSITAPTYTVTGTATDPSPNAGIDRVDVSTDGGATWNAASGTASWSFEWKIPLPGSHTIKSRAVDIDGNVESPGDRLDVTVESLDEPELQHHFWDASMTGGDCEVCHTATAYYRSNSTGFSTHTSTGLNYDRQDCTSCHTHSDGFSY